MRVTRPVGAKVAYQTITGETVETELDGLKARIFLHEFDHLIGVTFDSRVGDLKLKMATEKRRKLSKKLRNSFN